MDDEKEKDDDLYTISHIFFTMVYITIMTTVIMCIFTMDINDTYTIYMLLRLDTAAVFLAVLMVIWYYIVDPLLRGGKNAK